jgi:hypothetical protein
MHSPSLIEFFDHESAFTLYRQKNLATIRQDEAHEFLVFIQDFRIQQPTNFLTAPLPSLTSVISSSQKEPSSSFSFIGQKMKQTQDLPAILPSSFPTRSNNKSLEMNSNRSTRFYQNSSSNVLPQRSGFSNPVEVLLKLQKEASPPTTPPLTSPPSPIASNSHSRKRKLWNDEDMLQAMELVQQKKMSSRKAAAFCNVPRSTLWDRLSGRVIHGVDSRKKRKLNH